LRSLKKGPFVNTAGRRAQKAETARLGGVRLSEICTSEQAKSANLKEEYPLKIFKKKKIALLGWYTWKG